MTTTVTCEEEAERVCALVLKEYYSSWPTPKLSMQIGCRGGIPYFRVLENIKAIDAPDYEIGSKRFFAFCKAAEKYGWKKVLKNTSYFAPLGAKIYV